MIISLYYKEPDAGSEYTYTIKEMYPDIKPFSKKFWNKHDEFVNKLVKSLGNLAKGDEHLYIEVDTDNLDTIKVNGSKYKLVT